MKSPKNNFLMYSGQYMILQQKIDKARHRFTIPFHDCVSYSRTGITCKKTKVDLEKSGQLRKGTIVTEIVPASTVYQAEDYVRNIIKREAVEAVTTIQYKRFKISTHVYTRNQVRSN